VRNADPDAINSSGSWRIGAMTDIKTKLKGVEHEYYILLSLAITTVIVGTVVFHLLEKWSWVDSFYFTIITLATVGYGDLTPTTPVGKIVTVIFVIVGVGIFLAFLNKVMERRVERHKRRL
jgi:voltage-gated potassium channel Kch